MSTGTALCSTCVPMGTGIQLEILTAALADRYRLERPLGHGGMATVYLAHDLKHNREVALKVLQPELAEALGAQRFLKEIQLTAQLQHSHILPLFDSGSASGFLFYVMPRVRGESLRERLTRDTRLGVADALRIIQQIAGALDYAHRHGVIHRDIKPENILLQDGEAMLSDFGIAVGGAEEPGARLTGTGLSLGTIEYMSPEQAAGERVLDARSDIFSLASVAYELLAGRSPAKASSAQESLTKLMTETPPALRTVRNDVPPAMDVAVRRALMKTPSDRFATAREFSDALVAPMPERSRWLRPVAAVVGAGIVAVAAYALLRGRATSEAPPAQGAYAAITSIAVLPLDNRSADSTQNYFAEGMTDELTTTLATISALRVTSRGSAMQFQGAARRSPTEIGKILHVDAVLEGAVLRSGDQVRITAELIDARTDRRVWTKGFERKSSDVLALQAELATAIAQEINVRVTATEQARLASVPTVNSAGHDAYLLGRYFFNRPSDDNLRKAIAQFEKSVKLDPTFAAGYSGLSDAYLWAGYNEGFLTASMGKVKSKAAAERAVQLDSNSAEAHTSLASFLLFYERDWPACEREFRRAIALNPNYAFAHDQFGMALGFTGRFEESVAEGKRAAELDPLSPQVLIDASMPYIFRKDSTMAVALARRAGQLDSAYFFPPMIEGWAKLDLGQFNDAMPYLRKAMTMDAPPFVTAYLGYALGASGDRAGALAQLDALKKLSPDGSVLPFNEALIYLGTGDRTRAIEYLEKAYDADSQQLAWLGQDKIFDSLRSDPRFVALQRKLHFVR
jgi:TolB-like protein/tetratricopeptide (TPR) repeat protein